MIFRRVLPPCQRGDNTTGDNTSNGNEWSPNFNEFLQILTNFNGLTRIDSNAHKLTRISSKKLYSIY